MLSEDHVFATLDWRVVGSDEGDWAMEMDVTPRVVNSSGTLQGGLLATLIDMVAGSALVSGPEPYARSATSEMQVSFLAGARAGPVRAVATVLRRGGRSAVVRVDVRDLGAADELVAVATLRFAVTPRGSDR